MIELLTDQTESDAAFHIWVDAMLSRGRKQGYGWALEPSGLIFTNYGSAPPGVIKDQVMLGHDADMGDGTVKIVRPKTATNGKGKQTVIGRDKVGNLILLREGSLERNNVSRLIKQDFATLTGLVPQPVVVRGARSSRHWYVVAHLAHSKKRIVEETNRFTLACIDARQTAGGGRKEPQPEQPAYSFGVDEKYGVVTRTTKGGKKQVKLLQGAVFEALRVRLGAALTKPKGDGYEVDGLLEAANMLIEIKTGSFAKHCYEGVGQLKLYPSLIGLKPGLTPALLLPDSRPLRPGMASALRGADIKVFTYSFGEVGEKPQIKFSKPFLAACKLESG